jgi:dCTP deaminase
MILTAQQISEAYQRGDIVINPFEEEQVQAATYDLRVGEQGATTGTKKIVNIRELGYLLIQPGDFGVVTVLEEIRLGPQYAGRFGLRSKYARKGLIATTGPQIHPGYHGRIIVGVTNLTPKPISLPYKDDLLSVEIHRLEQATTKPYSGPYQDRLELGPEEIEAIMETEGMALSEVIKTLQSLSINVGIMATQMKWLLWVLPIAIAIIGIIVMIK